MYCVLNMGWTPSKYMNLPQKERAFVAASVLMKIDQEKAQAAKMKSQSGKARVRRR